MILNLLRLKGVVGFWMAILAKKNFTEINHAKFFAFACISLAFCFFSGICQAETVEKSMRLYQVGDLRGAEVAALKALSRSPDILNQAEGLKILGIIRFTIGDTMRAEAHFKEALSLNRSLALDQRQVLDPNIIPVWNRIKRNVARVTVHQSVNPSHSAPSKRFVRNFASSTTLKVVSTPVSSKIMVDGIFVGDSGHSFSVQPGTVPIEVVAKGYEVERRSVQLKSGEFKVLQIQLKRQNIPALAAIPAKEADVMSSSQRLSRGKSTTAGKLPMDAPKDGFDHDLFSEETRTRKKPDVDLQVNGDESTEFDRELAIERERVKRESKAKKFTRTRSVSPRNSDMGLSAPMGGAEASGVSWAKSGGPSSASASASNIRSSLESQRLGSQTDLYAPSVDNETVPTSLIRRRAVGKNELEHRSEYKLNRVEKKGDSYRSSVMIERPMDQGSSPLPDYVLPPSDDITSGESGNVSQNPEITDPALRRERKPYGPGVATILPFGIGQMSQRRYTEGGILFFLQAGLLYIGLDRTSQADNRELDLEQYIQLNCTPDLTLQDIIFRRCLTHLEKEYQGIDQKRSEANNAFIGFGALAFAGIVEALIWEPKSKSPIKKPFDHRSGLPRKKKRTPPTTANAENLPFSGEEGFDGGPQNFNRQSHIEIRPVFFTQQGPMLGFETSFKF